MQLALFWRFSITACFSPSASLTAGQYPLAPRPTLHALRPTLRAPRSSESADDAARQAGYSTPHPAEGQHATKCYVFRFFGEVRRAMFSAQVNMNSEVTSIPRLDLVERDSRHKYSIQKNLRRYGPRSIFLKKTPFRPHLRPFCPDPANKSALRAEGATHFLAPGKPA